MNLPLVVYVTLVVLSACLISAGVYVLLGLGYALIVGGIFAALPAELIRRGLSASRPEGLVGGDQNGE